MLLSRPENHRRRTTLPDYALFIARFLLFAAVHSALATRTIQNLCRNRADMGCDLYRVTYNLVSLAMFIWVMAAYRSSPVLYFAPGIWSLAMYAAQIILLLILADCVRQTGFKQFAGFSGENTGAGHGSKLITDRWYGLVRHPLYLFSTIFLMLNPVMTGQWLLLTAMSVIYFIIGGFIEEKRLLRDFGGEYQEYRRQVPFMIPSIKRRNPSG